MVLCNDYENSNVGNGFVGVVVLELRVVTGSLRVQVVKRGVSCVACF